MIRQKMKETAELSGRTVSAGRRFPPISMIWQRQGRLATSRRSVRVLRIINEPIGGSARLLAHKKNSGTIAVCDLGG